MDDEVDEVGVDIMPSGSPLRLNKGVDCTARKAGGGSDPPVAAQSRDRPERLRR